MKPETTFKVGNASASIFCHRNKNGETGQEFDSYSVHLHRRYEKSPGEWESTSYFRFFELPQVALVLQLATAYVAQREAEVRSSSSQAAAASQDEPHKPVDDVNVVDS